METRLLDYACLIRSLLSFPHRDSGSKTVDAMTTLLGDGITVFEAID